MRFDPDAIVEAALDRRRALLDDPDTDACRLLHGGGDGVPGLVVERLGPVLIVQLHEGHLRLSTAQVGELVDRLQRRFDSRAVYLKHFVRDRDHLSPEVAALHADPRPWRGEPVDAEFPVREYGLQFLVRAWGGFATGLYLEHREARRWLWQVASGRRVLNLFCYTCGFSVAAAAGGAAHVSSVDLAGAALEWGRRNFNINRLETAPHRFFRSDVLDFLRRAARQGRRYDLMVIDPPTFSRGRGRGRTFLLEKQLDLLLGGALALLDPGGQVLLSVHQRDLGMEMLEAAMAAAAAGRPFRILARSGPPCDYPGDPDFARSLLVQLDG